jgi:hypothetical protein
MQKRKQKTGRNRSPHDNYEVPAEADFGKLKFVGFGLDALERQVAKHTTVVLDSDVAQIFRSSKSVNTVLRGIIQGLSASQEQKKSA